MGAERERHKPKRDWIAWALLVALAGILAGAFLTATVGAGLAPIPVIGMLALLLMPFPTLAIYFGAATILYLLGMLLLRRAADERAWLRWAVLAGSVALPLFAGIAVADIANLRAGVADSSVTHPPGWSPPHVAASSSIALVDNDKTVGGPRCDAFCLALLVAGPVREVIVASTQSNLSRGTRLSGVAFALQSDWRACLGGLRDYLSVVRSSPYDRTQYFIDFGLDPFFNDELPRCLAKRNVSFSVGALPALASLDNEVADKLDSSKGAGWQPPYAEQRIFLPGGGDENRRSVRFGYRYVAPATIWPYGGNAGTGGTFSPSMMKRMLSTPSVAGLDGPSWWDMIADPRDLASRAVSILDRTIPDRQCMPQPGPCVSR